MFNVIQIDENSGFRNKEKVSTLERVEKVVLFERI